MHSDAALQHVGAANSARRAKSAHRGRAAAQRAL